MKVELINSLDFLNFPGIGWQIEQVKTGKSDELWIATPHEDAANLVKGLGLDPKRVYDMYSRAYLSDVDETQGIWFTDLPVPNEAQAIINDDWTKSIISQGHELAKVRWFANSQRLVQAVSWQDADGQIDYKDIYQRDGSIFAKQYFSEGQLLESDFYVGAKEPQACDFYFEGQRNFVYANGQKYANAEDYVAAVGNSFPENEYRITQVGREIDFAPANTVLTLPESVVDDQGNILGNLMNVLNNPDHKIKKVQVKPRDFAVLRKARLKLNKVSLLK
ncbi:glycosyltransferase [Convivina intestini]|uniref:glycosyltransferase n=1 Tax=Convivina intestini TaxID=1505726 RepID=UPI002010609A|nr:glycosyltransferase [Convivina intestini]CAH1854766.1 UDP-N-acetylglucosamine--peptide N-acetylglucosaminyltransferase stabilizing protein GtfB [Convivina intestini]